MQWLATDIILVVPEKVTYSGSAGNVTIDYAFSKAKWLKGESSVSPLKIYGYPLETARQMSQVLRGNTDDSFLGTPKGKIIDLLFLYKDKAGHLLYIPFGGPFLVKLAERIDDLTSLNDLPIQCLKARDDYGLDVVAFLTRGSSDAQWRGAVAGIENSLSPGKTKNDLLAALKEPSWQGQIDPEDVIPELHTQRQKRLEEAVAQSVGELLKDVNGADAKGAVSLFVGKSEIENTPKEKIESTFGALQKNLAGVAAGVVQLNSVNRTGQTIIAHVTLTANGVSRRYRALFDLGQGAELKWYSFDPEP